MVCGLVVEHSSENSYSRSCPSHFHALLRRRKQRKGRSWRLNLVGEYLERKLGKRNAIGNNDPAIFQEFREALGTRDSKTIAAYVTTIRDFVIWLAAQQGGTPTIPSGVADRNSGAWLSGLAPKGWPCASDPQQGTFWIASVLPVGDG